MGYDRVILSANNNPTHMFSKIIIPFSHLPDEPNNRSSEHLMQKKGPENQFRPLLEIQKEQY